MDLLNRSNVEQLSGALVALLQDEQSWQCRHGGLLGIKYLLATRPDLTHALMPSLYPHVFEGMKDGTDDVVMAAASALVPVAHECVFNEHIDTDELVVWLWDALKALDEVSSATNELMALLSEVLKIQAADDLEAVRSSRAQLPVVVPRLFKYLGHASKSVRRSALATIATLTDNAELAEMFLPGMVGDLFCFLFRQAVVEHHEENLRLVEKIWEGDCSARKENVFVEHS